MSIVDPSVLAQAPGAGDPSSGLSGGDVYAEARPMRADVWRRFRRNRLAMAALSFLALLVLAAIFAPLITRYGPTERVPAYRQAPSREHWFGTDRIGRDVFSRIIYGARVSLRIGFLATAISLCIGIVSGSVSGFFGGWVDTVLMRITDVFLAIPYIVLAVAIAGLKQLEYVEAARALGYSRRRIVFRHILPNALQPIIVYGTIAIGSVILAEAALSFLGVGPQDPTPAWGLMVSDGKGDLVNAFHLLAFPGAAICLTVLAFVLIGDGLRDALDPKLR
jgi:ABC-type dipeptide/oligopeptide/nickel transport system permease subunit